MPAPTLSRTKIGASAAAVLFGRVLVSKLGKAGSGSSATGGKASTATSKQGGVAPVAGGVAKETRTAQQADGHPDGVAFRRKKSDEPHCNIPNGVQVDLISHSGEWCCVLFEGEQGFVKARNLLAVVSKRKVDNTSQTKSAVKKAKCGSGSVDGKNICFTGSLVIKRAEAEAAAVTAGAKVLSGVSKNLHILVAGPGAGAKMDKAKSFGTEVWDEATFKAAVGL